MASKNSHSQEPTPLEIATLAARFLPPLDLSGISPDECWHPLLIRQAIGELTTGKGRSSGSTYAPPEGWETPFEIIAGEAVKRARVLLSAAAGKTRQEVKEYALAGREASSALQSYDEARDKIRQDHFQKLAAGRPTIPMDEVLKFSLGRVYAHKPANALEVMRKYFSDSVMEVRKKHGKPLIPVIFADCATDIEKQSAVDSMSAAGLPACIVLPHTCGYEVDESEFPYIVLGLREFYKRRGEAITKELKRQGGGKGGTNTQAHARKGKLTVKDSAALIRAAKKVKIPLHGA